MAEKPENLKTSKKVQREWQYFKLKCANLLGDTNIHPGTLLGIFAEEMGRKEYEHSGH